MKIASTALLATLIAVAGALGAAAAPSSGARVVAQAGSPPPANFGTPPSGQIPILYNDHHVYTKPDVLKQGRVLSALVRNGTLLIPLRSMFEQMGATVSYDAASKTATVSKPGAEVKVTVGKPEVVINGETRPLDVPPIVYQGSVLVPVRVIAEGMGAYVLWVGNRQRVVVVRYLPATPPPPPPPSAAPPPPPPTPAPTPKPAYKDLFVAGDYIISPKVYNEFSPGNTGTSSYAVRGAFEFNALNIPWMIEGSFEQFGYPHNCGTSTSTSIDPQCFVTTIGGQGRTLVPAFTARDTDVDARLGIRVFNPRVYIGVGYLWRSTNYGYPNMNGVGFGAEKLPDLNTPLSFFGSYWYYPSVKGTFGPFDLEYNLSKYQVGAVYVIGASPVFIEAGWMGDSLNNKVNAPSQSTANGPFAGLGIKF